MEKFFKYHGTYFHFDVEFKEFRDSLEYGKYLPSVLQTRKYVYTIFAEPEHPTNPEFINLIKEYKRSCWFFFCKNERMRNKLNYILYNHMINEYKERYNIIIIAFRPVGCYSLRIWYENPDYLPVYSKKML